MPLANAVRADIDPFPEVTDCRQACAQALGRAMGANPGRFGGAIQQMSPEAQAEFHKYVAYGPVTPGAWDFIPQEEWARLPSSPENLAQSLFLNVDWWLANEPAMIERYNTLMQQ